MCHLEDYKVDWSDPQHDAHVQDYRRWRRWSLTPIYRPLVQLVGN